MICIFYDIINIYIYRNNDGKVSLNQFFNFLSISSALFEPLENFRLAIITNILTYGRIKIILERRANILNIYKYLECNHNKLPPEPCLVRFRRMLNGEPHPFKYDYDNRMRNVTFTNVLINYIKKYNEQYVFKQEAFAIKWLSVFKQNEYIREIDNYYVIIRANNPELTRRKSQLASTKSDLGKISETHESRRKSILRQRRSQLSTSTRRLSASGALYNLTSQSQNQNNLPKCKSSSSRHIIQSPSSIVPFVYV